MKSSLEPQAPALTPKHSARRVTAPQTLLIDADDTLWENNIYFEQAIADFITLLDHKTHSRAEVRAFLNGVERESILKHGYGLHSFAHSLVDCFERLSVEPVAEALHKRIWSFAHRIAEKPIELRPRVRETLAELLHRGHHMIVMTKGSVMEQTDKVERSGVKQFFAAVEIVAEKHAAAYRGIMEKYALSPESTWMIGNSPKSDINPALAAGIHAIFIPHEQTWVLEHEEVRRPPTPAQRLLVLESFAELETWF